MDRDIKMPDAGSLRGQQKLAPAPAPGRVSPSKRRNSQAITTEPSVTLEDGRIIPRRYLYPVSTKTVAAKSQVALPDIHVCLLYINQRHLNANANKEQHIHENYSPPIFEFQKSVPELAAIQNSVKPMQTSRHLGSKMDSTPPALSSLEEFMKEIERSSPSRQQVSPTIPAPSQNPTTTHRLLPNTDPMHLTSDEPRSDGPGRTVLRRDTDIENGNVISPTVSKLIVSRAAARGRELRLRNTLIIS